MSATASDAVQQQFEAGAVAHVLFRVRCERFGLGEEVFLVSTDGKQVRNVWRVCVVSASGRAKSEGFLLG